MDNFMQQPEPQKRNNSVFLAAVGIGIVAVVAFLFVVSLKTSTNQIQTDVMKDAFREGSPEFEKYTKKIVAERDEKHTMQSPTGMGTITMSIPGRLYNFTGKPLTGLEIRVSVVDMQNVPIKEKTTVVLPKDGFTRLESGQILPVQVTIEGIPKDSDLANIRWKVTGIKVGAE